MKYYKSPNNQVFAYEQDGSQDYLISANFIEITQEEAVVLGKEWAQKTIPSAFLPPETVVE
jgi:hypothetical protein